MEVIRLDIPQGYEFCGIEFDNGKILLRKKHIEYPKNYEECQNILSPTDRLRMARMLHKDYAIILEKFSQLLLCRDVYWRIDNNWKPMKSPAKDVKRYVITTMYDEAVQMGTSDMHYFVLEFRTKELRDTFYANFKGLIEQCKEFL